MFILSNNNEDYHKFSYGAASYALNGKNVNAMLELLISTEYLDSLKTIEL